MKQIRKILELHQQPEAMSHRTIAKITGVSRPVVKQYISLLSTHPATAQDLQKMSDSELNQHLGLEAPVVQETPENKVLLEWLETHIGDLQKTGVTRRVLHEDYLKEHPEGLQYSQFCFVLTQRYQAPEASSLLTHKAGDKLYIDFTGHKAIWTDCLGVSHTEEIYLAVLGASGFLYSIPTFSQKQEDLAEAVVETFHTLGGVPRAVVPDCLKSAVLENDGYEPVINPLFQKVMDFYHTVCLPARPKHPKDKALVEGAVNLVYRQILSRLKDKVFVDRKAMLLWWQAVVDKINATGFQKLPGSRATRFQEIDKPVLKPLPEYRFAVISIGAQTVTATGVVYVPQDKTSYSVPYSLQGKKVEILSFADRIEVWYENQRQAVHRRQPQSGQVILNEHRPPDHQKYEDRDNEYEILRCLTLRGSNVVHWVAEMGQRCDHEDQKWRIIHGLIKLADQHTQRIDTVCRLAIRNENWTLKHLRAIIKSGEDIPLTEAEEKNWELSFSGGEVASVEHENVRGPEHYNRQLAQEDRAC